MSEVTYYLATPYSKYYRGNEEAFVEACKAYGFKENTDNFAACIQREIYAKAQQDREDQRESDASTAMMLRALSPKTYTTECSTSLLGTSTSCTTR